MSNKKDKSVNEETNQLSEPFDFFQIVDHFFRSEPLKQFMNEIDSMVLDSFPNHQIHVNTYETDKNYHIDFKFPPVKKEQVTLELLNQSLTLSIINHEEIKQYNENSSTFRSFTSHDSISRSILLPFTVNKNEIKTTFKKGALLVKIPKRIERLPIQDDSQ